MFNVPVIAIKRNNLFTRALSMKSLQQVKKNVINVIKGHIQV